MDMPKDEQVPKTRMRYLSLPGLRSPTRYDHAGNVVNVVASIYLLGPSFISPSPQRRSPSSSAQHARQATLPLLPDREASVRRSKRVQAARTRTNTVAPGLVRPHLTNPSPSLRRRDISTVLPCRLGSPHQHRKTISPETSGCGNHPPRGAWPWQTSVPRRRPRARLRRRHTPRPSPRYSSPLYPTLRASSGVRPSRARCSSRDSERSAPTASAACTCERAVPTCAPTLVFGVFALCAGACYVVACIASLK